MPSKPFFRVVVAEDDPGVRELLCTRLSLAGYQVHSARNGAEAVRMILEVRPDVVVLDVNMPEIDGFGVLAAIRNRQGVTSRILMLTARHAAEDVRKALSLGAKDYMAKPFSDAQLLARVARLLRPPRTAPQVAAQAQPAQDDSLFL